MRLECRVGPGTRGPGACKKFFPSEVFKDTVAIFVPFTLLLVTAIVVKAPPERLADPPSRVRIAPCSRVVPDNGEFAVLGNDPAQPCTQSIPYCGRQSIRT
jgi:hypothetical protein